MKSLFIWLILVRYVRSYIILLNSTDKHMDRLASFGPSLTEDGIIGNLQVADGCRIVDPPPCDNWIALVERGNCTFIDKVRFMQQSNAKAVIVGDRRYNGWVTMYTSGNSSDIKIPSVYVPQMQFLSLLDQLHKNSDRSIPIKLATQNSFFSSYLLDIITTTIMPPAALACIVYFIWKLRHQPKRKRRRGVREISHLPIKTFCEKGEPDECVICLEEYQQGDLLRILPCKHHFHSNCIDTWLLTRKKYCPICKRDVFQPDENTPLL